MPLVAEPQLTRRIRLLVPVALQPFGDLPVNPAPFSCRIWPSAMDDQCTIGELARAAGIPTSTVRFYERAGLLKPAGRTASNYRFYDDNAVDRLRFIKAAQASGFTIGDIRALIELRDGTSAPCTEVQALIDTRHAQVVRQLDDLRHVKDVLESSMIMCREAQRDGRCEVMERLEAAEPTKSAQPSRQRGKSAKT